MPGKALSPEDQICGHAIERLICAFVFAVGDMTARFGNFARPCREITQALVAGGDREWPSSTKPGGFKIKPEARAWTRLIASCFDACLRAKDARLPQLV
jgi:coproporphyrinogen III oxidase-like Fe-S oxidoreductase